MTFPLLFALFFIQIVFCGRLLRMPIEKTQSNSKEKIRFLKALEKERTYIKNNGEDEDYDEVVPIHNYDNSQFTGWVSIGTPRQYFETLFDSGSSDFWIPSSQCTDSICLEYEEQRYDHSVSSTYEPHDGIFEILYADMSEVIGHLSQDIVRIGDYEDDSYNLCSFEPCIFAEVDEEADQTDNAFSGILGVGYPSLCGDGNVPILDQMYQQGVFDEFVFSFYFTEEQDASEMIIGGIDESKYQGELVYLDVIEPYFYWEVYLDAVLFDNDGENRVNCETDTQHGYCTVLPDTGTSLIYVPAPFRTLVRHSEVNWDCSNFDELNDITFVFGENSFTMTPEMYVIREGSMCFSGIVLDEFEPSMFILGDLFMTHFYTVFDRENNRIGLAPNA